MFSFPESSKFTREAEPHEIGVIRQYRLTGSQQMDPWFFASGLLCELRFDILGSASRQFSHHGTSWISEHMATWHENQYGNCCQKQEKPCQ